MRGAERGPPFDMATFSAAAPESGLAAVVKSFGRRQAYESLRRTNPRAGGARYGDLAVGLGWKDPPRAGDWRPAAATDAPDTGLGIELRGGIAAAMRMSRPVCRVRGAGHP